MPLVVQEALFRSFHRDYRPLSHWLRAVVTGPIERDVLQMTAEQLLEADLDGLATELIERFRREPPHLGATELARRDIDGGFRRPVDEAMSVGTHRFYFATQVYGDMESLQNWPDKANVPLTPIDMLGSTSRSSPQLPIDAVRAHLAELRHEQWFLHDRGEVGGPMALFTFVDITEDELEDAEHGWLDLRDVVDSERRYIEPIVQAIAAQMQAFYEPLPDQIADLIRNRARWHTRLATVSSALTWREKWTYPAPALERAGTDDPPAGDPAFAGDPKSSSPAEANDDGLDLPKMRLSKANFDDVVKTVRVWANAVERYQDAFGKLEEEHLSDLLCATLNAALPRAGREVYSRAGKTDLFVHADAIDDGAAPLKVFIAECKWWSGPSDADDALTQLRGYLEVKDTAAMLVFFSRRVDVDGVRAKALQVMLDAGAILTNESPTQDWPYVRWGSGARQLTLCVAVIDLPTVADVAAGPVAN